MWNRRARARSPSIILAGDAAALLSTPPPPVDAAAAEAALRRHYGIEGRARPLAAERDRNFMMSLEDSARRVFKVYHEADNAAVRDFQNGVLPHMERVGVACTVPRLIATREGARDCEIAGEGRTYRAILISVVPGEARDLSDAGPALRRDLGRAAAEIGTALAGYDHLQACRILLWDPMQLGRLAGAVELIAGPAPLAGRRGRAVRRRGPPPGARLAGPGHPQRHEREQRFRRGRAGQRVIDFGDMVRAPRINEIAIAANYAVAEDRDPLAAIGDVLDGYDARRPLEEAEVELLFDLVLARLAVRMLMYRWRAELFPENRAYILRNDTTGARLADALAGPAPGAGRGAILERWTPRRRRP